MQFKAVLSKQFEWKDRIIWVNFLQYFRTVVLLTGSEYAQLKFVLQSVQNLNDMGSYFQVDSVISIFITNVNSLSPSHILFGCIPVHHLSVDQSFIQIEDDSYSTFMVGCQFDVFVGLFRHSCIGKWLKGWKWVDEVV